MKQAFRLSGLILTGLLTLFSFHNRLRGGGATGSNQSLKLDGPGWLLDTDPKNTAWRRGFHTCDLAVVP